MYLYCKCWSLEVNVTKTKIVIFRKRSYKLNDNLVFNYNGQNIDIVNEFTYLGIVLTTKGSLCKNKEKLVSQARKAIHSIFKNSRTLCLPIDIQIEMFDTMVKPLYYINVWL